MADQLVMATLAYGAYEARHMALHADVLRCSMVRDAGGKWVHNLLRVLSSMQTGMRL